MSVCDSDRLLVEVADVLFPADPFRLVLETADLEACAAAREAYALCYAVIQIQFGDRYFKSMNAAAVETVTLKLPLRIFSTSSYMELSA